MFQETSIFFKKSMKTEQKRNQSQKCNTTAKLIFWYLKIYIYAYYKIRRSETWFRILYLVITPYVKTVDMNCHCRLYIENGSWYSCLSIKKFIPVHLLEMKTDGNWCLLASLEKRWGDSGSMASIKLKSAEWRYKWQLLSSSSMPHNTDTLCKV